MQIIMTSEEWKSLDPHVRKWFREVFGFGETQKMSCVNANDAKIWTLKTSADSAD